MTSLEAAELLRLLLRGVGGAQVRAWVGRFVHGGLLVDRWRYRDHWSTITRCWSTALQAWAEGRDLADVGVWIRKGDACYDLWSRQTGSRAPVYDTLRLFLLRLSQEWIRQSSIV